MKKKKERFYVFKVTKNGKPVGRLVSSALNKNHAIKKAKAWEKWVAKRGFPNQKTEYVGLERYKKSKKLREVI